MESRVPLSIDCSAPPSRTCVHQEHHLPSSKCSKLLLGISPSSSSTPFRPTMVEPVARIRLYQPEDKKLVQFIIGKDDMEALAVANKRGMCLSVSCEQPYSRLYSVLSSLDPCHMDRVVLYIRSGGGLAAKTRTRISGILESASSLRVYGGPNNVPLRLVRMHSVYPLTWADTNCIRRLNRPTFEDRAQDDLRRPDLVDIPSYYSRSPSSGLWILELGDKFVGLIALDASSDSTSTETISTSAPPVKTRDGKVKYTKGTSSTATIRHFYVEELYRPAGIQHDLLTHAVRMAFSRDPKVQTIRASDTPLKPYVSEALRQARFQLEAKTEKVGMLRWQNSTHILRRKGWKS